MQKKTKKQKNKKTKKQSKRNYNNMTACKREKNNKNTKNKNQVFEKRNQHQDSKVHQKKPTKYIAKRKENTKKGVVVKLGQTNLSNKKYQLVDISYWSHKRKLKKKTDFILTNYKKIRTKNKSHVEKNTKIKKKKKKQNKTRKIK